MEPSRHGNRAATDPPGARDSRRFPPELYRVIAVAATWSFAYAAFYLLPKYMEQALAASRAEIGLVMGSFGWATVAVAPFATGMISRRSSRAVFAIGTVSTAFTSLAFLVAGGSIPALVALRIAQAFAHALVFTALSFAAAEFAPPERLSQALGICGASMLVMNALAPAVLEPVATAFGWPTVFVLSSVVASFGAVLSLRLPGARPREVTSRASGMIDVLRTPIGRDFALVAMVSGLAFGTVFAFEPSLALALGREHVSGFFVGFAVGAITVRLGLGHLPDRLGRRRVALAMFTLYALTVLSFTIVPGSLLELVGVSFGVAHGLFYPALNGLALTAVATTARAGILTVFTAAFYLGFSGPAVLGPLAEAAGLRTVFAVVAAATFCGVALLARSRTLRESSPAAVAASLSADAA
jgi:predicted MFS family arabinose efflux permease